MVRYILITELKTTSYTSCNLLDLPESEMTSLEIILGVRKIPFSNQESFFEVDMEGIKLINLLASDDFSYRVSGQSMAIEKSNIGGRTTLLQKTVWTMAKN
ncbi:hypothetical protein K1T71_006191 [Dendrolimus kikuchii]|uniref:Uncharacterized protein n=1 Tax=Dendrolimus kikuchii TaxID=765133 RepID=A0ACC1D392_9NEOP|nr:hypothetical protein K1T71_006191 [Dendrolimus kikuchii]